MSNNNNKMDITIRNIDKRAYERIRLYARLYNMTIGEATTRLIHCGFDEMKESIQPDIDKIISDS